MKTFAGKAAVSADKVRGDYYTPVPVARFLARWVRQAGPRILEPSCGDGRILRELAGDTAGWDGVAGNPPYIRFGNWAGAQRDSALVLMRREGLRPSRLTNA